MHTLYTQDLIEISLFCNDILAASSELIKDMSDAEENSKSHIFSLLCELVWLNSSILLLLRKDFTDLVFKDDSQEEVLISKVTLDTLTTLMLAKHQATVQLNKFSYSLSFH